ncbi:CRISPR-associated endonuclease Cas6 [Candidatus Manganitrophus noduliformans]|uniref:DNA repair protein n=1 Tax=Candidatus Manganitrophus noduliformans TaxID=2606439 RepID=A0A7X6DUI8_9BACT|nr:CRISPR-associated endonuclease Cas6 [Candidatus Manganitrophus noduliformans]NKE73662.1 DNA repair protein [Candidatus Manganitrophus noduliformans]
MARLVNLKETIKIRHGILTFRLEGNKPVTGQGLRAAIARLCPHYPQLAQRTLSGELIYRHPHIQFKTMDGMGVITALGEEAGILVEVFATLPEIVLGGRRIRIVEKKIEVQDVLFGPTDKEYEYVFTSPWFALNQENEKIYSTANEVEKHKLLNKVLAGNFLSMAKGLGFFLVPHVRATVQGRWSESPSLFKGVLMRGIRCRFQTHFQIPFLWGIGKSSSSGWGTTIPASQGENNVA